MPPLLLKLLFTLMPKRAPGAAAPPRAQGRQSGADQHWSIRSSSSTWRSGKGELGKSEWFAGDAFTAADIQMSFPLEAAAARGGLEQGHPKAMAFLDRIHAPPGLCACA